MSRDGGSRELSLLLTVLCNIVPWFIYEHKSSARPSCITRPFTAWHMLRPHACISSHKKRFAIGLETGEREGKRSLSDGDCRWGDKTKKMRFGTISHFSPCVWHGIKIQEETWCSVRIFHEPLVLRNTRFSAEHWRPWRDPWLNHAWYEIHWGCRRFCKKNLEGKLSWHKFVSN